MKERDCWGEKNEWMSSGEKEGRKREIEKKHGGCRVNGKGEKEVQETGRQTYMGAKPESLAQGLGAEQCWKG